jgi:DNA-directed RNA polymerase subunit omega
MRDDHLKEAPKITADPCILLNVISTRVKMLRRGSRPLIETLEKLALEDSAMREVIEGRTTPTLGNIATPVN